MQSFTKRSEHKNNITILSGTYAYYYYILLFYLYLRAHSFTGRLASLARRVIYAQITEKKLPFHVDITDDNLRARALAGQRIMITAGEEGIRGGSPPADVKITAVSSAGDATPMEQQHRVPPPHRSPPVKFNIIIMFTYHHQRAHAVPIRR